MWYARDDSTTVYTQIPSSLRDPVVGEHIYTEKRYGEIPVRYWKVVHRPGQCIHNGYTGKNWHGVSFGRQNACSIIIPAGKPIVRIVEKPLKSTISI